MTFNPSDDPTDARTIRARQHEVVAELGTFALRNLSRSPTELDALMDRVVGQVAETLDVAYCKVLELLPGGGEMLLRAGVGWCEGLVGKATVDTGPNSQAGYTLWSDEPVVVEVLSSESRFTGPDLLVEHGVVSGMSCVITGPEGELWGVLGAHSTSLRRYTPDDVFFLQSVANLLGGALQQQAALGALRASEERLNRVLEHLPVGVIIADADGTLLYGNTEIERLFDVRFPPEEGDWSKFDCMRDEPFPPERIPMNRTLRDGEFVVGEEMRVRRADGDMRHLTVNTAPVRDELGRIVLGVAAFTDITERKRAHEDRDREHKVLLAVLDALPTAVIIADVEGRIVRENAATGELWGESTVEKASSWRDYGAFPAWWPESGERIAAEEWAMTRALRDGEVTRNELIEYEKLGSGERGYALNNAAPVRNDDGMIVGGVVAMMDVTHRLTAERLLREHKELLEERVRQRTDQVRQLAGSLSRAEQVERARIAQVLHDEVQQLLYAVKIQIDLLDRTLGTEAKQELSDSRELLQNAIDSTRRLTLSINPPVLRGEGLAAGFRWLAAEVEETYSLHIDLQLELDEKDPLAVDQRALILRTVRELLFNVVKHAGVDRAVLAAVMQDGGLRVEVRDEGKGFDASSAFGRNARSFGLANICERLALHGGALEIDTGEGSGTRAMVWLPGVE